MWNVSRNSCLRTQICKNSKNISKKKKKRMHSVKNTFLKTVFFLKIATNKDSGNGLSHSCL